MNPRIIAVEDNQRHYENLVSILRTIPSKDKLEWGIEDFAILQARSSLEAEDLLHEMQDACHILVLDLKIPKRVGLIPDSDNGFEILSLARKLGKANQIIIYTNYQSQQNLLKALREGANDFLQKPVEAGVADQELQARFMSCWQRVLATESARLLEKRIKDLIPYAEAGLAHRFTACFSDFVQTVAHSTEDIEHYAQERFGIDRQKDSQDYLIRCLENQEARLKTAQQNWADLKADLLSVTQQPTIETVESLLASIQENLSPCQFVKNTSITMGISRTGQTSVLSFQDDVRMVLQEITAGALGTLTDYGNQYAIDITMRVRDGQAEMQFSDNFEQQISREDAQAINGGFSVSSNHGRTRFGRAWGLSVAQHIALRGGGRLIVKSESPLQGNVVTYFIPLAQ
jgi:CheY-like chemotaxis protein